jgi:hypothetical protein
MKGPFLVFVEGEKVGVEGQKRLAQRLLDHAIANAAVGTKGEVRDGDNELVIQRICALDDEGKPYAKWLES